MSTFNEMGLSDEVLQVLEDLGFETPTEIQKMSIPYLLEAYNDFIGLAQTGTGKTAAFGIPLLERIDPDFDATQALVLAPTRELGQQIAQQLDQFGKYLKKVNVLPVYGGAAISNQIRALKRATQHIIIATPGRLIDLIKRKAIKLDQIHVIVLDEADEMLNMGFKEDIDEILSFTPEDKMTWLFSATMPDPIKKIVKKYMDDPYEVKVDQKTKVNTNIDHQFIVVKQSNKSEALKRILDLNANMRGVVFCRTKRDTQELAEELLKRNYKADALHGDLSQAQRDRVMKRFKEHDLQVLIATDVAARGIDVQDLSHVIHFTLPDDAAYYTHRSGRTARAGKKGVSMAFINGREFYRINRLQKELDISFTKMDIPSNEAIVDIRIENWCNDLKELDAEKVNAELLEKTSLLLDEMSKEDLLKKMLYLELKSLHLGRSGDLNEDIEKDRGRGGRDRGGRRRERGGRDRRDRRDRGRGERRERGGKRSDKDKRGKSKSKRRYGSDDSHDIKKKDDRKKDKSKDKSKDKKKKSKRKDDFKKSDRKKDSGKSRRKKA
ncbi:MAG: DEAD/DEAH box helicase [Saprospiraceae bacterium]|nr:DEAD/DEAH box helicase [Bacteroidia bacterium]NNE13946.1 DEAD/DEAH box helicase [Saprospiraceae bacterium]